MIRIIKMKEKIKQIIEEQMDLNLGLHNKG